MNDIHIYFIYFIGESSLKGFWCCNPLPLFEFLEIETWVMKQCKTEEEGNSYMTYICY